MILSKKFGFFLETSLFLYNNISLHFDWHFVCSIYQILNRLSQWSLSQPTLFPIPTYALPPTHLIRFSCSLSPSLPLIPHSIFTCLGFYIKRKWFELPASVNKLNSPNIVPHLGFAHNTNIFRMFLVTLIVS